MKKNRRRIQLTPIIGAVVITLTIAILTKNNEILKQIKANSPDRADAQALFNISTQPTNIRTTSLDSTIRLEWTPVADSRIAWQMATTKDTSGKVVSTKVVNPTANAIDINGLRTGERYNISLQLISQNNEISPSIETTAMTSLQLPMRNAIFYDNFNDLHHGSMDSNFYDVRTYSEFGDTMTVPGTINTMLSERHYHTQLIESNGDGGVHARARIPVSLSNNTATFQFETDISAIQDGPGQQNNSHGKWWVVAFSNKIVNTHQDFTHGATDPSLVSIDFSAYGKRSADRSGTNLAKIGVIANGKRQEFIGTKPLITAPNVRVPITVNVSKTAAAMFVNGEKVLEATGLSLPLDEGYWSIGQANYRSGFIDIYGDGLDQPRVSNQLVHWDTIQFDSPTSQNYIPTIRTYQAPSCSGPVWFNMRSHAIHDCDYLINRGKLSSQFTINIDEDLTKVRSAKLLLNGPHNADLIVTANDIEIARFAPNSDSIHIIHTKDLNSTQLRALRKGSNTIKVSTSNYDDYRGVGAFQLEIIYNIPKIFTNPPLENAPRIAALGIDFSYDKKNFPSGKTRGISYIYSSGGDEPIDYTIKMHSNNTPWLRIVSPLTGQVKPVSQGGRIIPIEFEVDFSKYVNPHGSDTDKPNGQLGIIRVEGSGSSSHHPIEMPASIVILAVDYEMPNRPANFYPISHYTPSLQSFDRTALPAGDEVFRKYFVSNTNVPTTTPTPMSTPVSTPVATPVRTSTPTPNRTTAPTPVTSPVVPLPSSSSAILYKAINLNGPTISANGITYEAQSSAGINVSANTFSNQSVPLLPSTSSEMATIIRSSIWGNGSSYPRINIPNMPRNNYNLYVYTWEDNNSETFSMSVEGNTKFTHSSGVAGSWKKHGPYTIAVTDGTMNITFSGGNANISALEIWNTQNTTQRPEQSLVIQAEDFIDAFDTTANNIGGAYRNSNVDIERTSDPTGGNYNVGWTAPGEWLRYSFTSESGRYRVRPRVAHINPGAKFSMSIDNTSLGELTIPNTGSWQTFTTLQSNEINLSAGTHSLIVNITDDANGASGNFNYFEIIKL